MKNYKNYIYVRGIPELDELKDSSKIPIGSWSFDFAYRIIKEKVERGELNVNSTIVVELGKPLAFYIFIAYVLSIIVEVILS